MANKTVLPIRRRPSWDRLDGVGSACACLRGKRMKNLVNPKAERHFPMSGKATEACRGSGFQPLTPAAANSREWF
ncbi:hypothetical protein RJJ65_22455 [Rhizobium hidalgonense]|uniref:Uncharacterized protein n=1 Tax=Rhizobium hidalgonense TaxID=1538159 RepID=A0AAJ2LP59_9HYPH|nr:hypothetical protein [Rhizobium hidalgonense]MDR9775364.1 hypothetical protein [Rhizobium hidalgonense]